MNDNRIIAHTLILSSVTSPCRKYLLFGTNTHKILIYSLFSLSYDAQIEGKPECIINVKYARTIYSLCFGRDFVFCGSVGLIVIYKWTTPNDGFLKYYDTVHLTSTNIYATVSEVTGLCYNAESDSLLAALGDGTIHTFFIGCGIQENIILAGHKSTIYRICNVGTHEFGTSSEDGTVCFWDQRIIQNGIFQASSIFRPYLTSILSRPKLGSWLTTLSCKQSEEDWFVTGGGPRLSLWSRRAGRDVSILHPEGVSDTWYSQTAIFCDIDNDSRIVSGGNSSTLYMWDHIGNLLASVDLHNPPNSRLSHILVVDTMDLSDTVDSLQLKYHSNCAFFIGGCGPVIRLIANLGYPLDKDVSVKSTSSFESQSIRSNKKGKFTTTDKKSNRDKSYQPINLKEQSTSNNRTKEIWFDDVPKALIDNSLQDQSATTKSLVKLTSFTGPTRRIAMDCEFVGVGYEGKDDALARVSIVNQFGHTLFDAYVRPEERVVDYRTKFSGIRPRDLRKNGPARSFSDVHKEVAELIKNKILIGHSILKDLKVLRLSHPRRFIRDTSRYRPFRDLFNGRIPSLKALTQKVLGINVQIGEHDSVEDARATMRLYTSVKRIWESSKKQRMSMMKQTKNNKNNKQKNTITAEKQIVLNAKDEYESGLQETISNHSLKQSTTTASSTPHRTTHRSKPWDPKRARKCSKNRVKFLNRRRKQQQHQQQHKNK
ncbi:unnamed protein product [Schistosoma turkestanicum]|nr:unnamed protein product [Schistosoma turkestanicum]